MKQQLKRSILLGMFALGGVVTANAEWCYSDCGNERYDPDTGMAEYKDPYEGWTHDEYYEESNSAYAKYKSGACEFSGGGSHYAYQSYGSILNGGRGRIKLITGGVSYKLQQDIRTGLLSYEESTLPEWSYNTFGGISYDDSDFRVNSGQLYQNTRITTLNMGVTAKKDRLSLTGTMRYEYTHGYDDFSGTDSDVAGFLFMPGYQILSQDEQFVDLGLYGMLDLSYAFREQADNQTRVMPGVAVTARRTTPIGLFTLAYSYEYNRNLSGDEEITGKSHLDTHHGLADYVLPITKNFYFGGGLLYTYATDMPSDVEDDFLEAHLTAGAVQLKNWNFTADVYSSIDGTGNLGVSFMAGYLW